MAVGETMTAGNPPRLLVATRNPGKLEEYAQLLRAAPYQLVSLDEAGVSDEVDETGATFAENAWLKAEQYAARSGLLTLADDSGLEVDALGRAPGVHSARYGGAACATDADRVALLLRNLRGVPMARRTARFRCVIALADGAVAAGGPPPRWAAVEGAVAGMIQYAPAGEGGFGYDPVFLLPSFGRTAAQLSLTEKNRISHRGDAAARAVKLLQQRRQPG